MSQQAEEPRTVGEEAQPEQEHRATAHPIATAVDSLIHRARDTKVAVRQFLPAAIKIQKTRYKRIRKTLNDNVGLLEDPDTHTRVLAQKEIQGALVQFQRLHRSRVPEALETGLFLGLFSAFDAFTGDLLKGLYARKPGLIGSFNKSLSFADVLEAPSIEALKLQVLEDNIESLRRKSYVDQFATIGQRFDVKVTAFDRWPDFVECSQRRNLLTHCDGIVTDQYLSVCREAGLDASRLPKGGSQVKLGAKYFFTTCELVMEVGIKLGHTLWRKALPEELEEADKHLMEKLFEALENGIWSRARVIGEFAFNQKKLSTDFDRKIVTANYAQALKRDGAVEEAKQILDDVDWSAAGERVQTRKGRSSGGLPGSISTDEEDRTPRRTHFRGYVSHVAAFHRVQSDR